MTAEFLESVFILYTLRAARRGAAPTLRTARGAVLALRTARGAVSTLRTLRPTRGLQKCLSRRLLEVPVSRDESRFGDPFPCHPADKTETCIGQDIYLRYKICDLLVVIHKNLQTQNPP